MAIVKPFKALRYSEKAGNIENLVCPPYDIIGNEQRKTLLDKNKFNMVRLELPKDGEDVYATANSTLKNWLKNSIMVQDENDSFYIYEEIFEVENKSYSLKGVIGKVKLTDFEEGVVIPHENTLSAAKEDRFNLMCATNCNFSQVYCLFEDENKKISDKMNNISKNAPIYCFKDTENVIHKLWKTEDTTDISKLFENKCLYIADGHHRYETGLRYRDTKRKQGADVSSDSEYIMMMLVPMECKGLVVFPTHRIVHSLKEFDLNSLLSGCEEYFHIESFSSVESVEKKLKTDYNDNRISFGLYCEEKYCILRLKDNVDLQHLLPETDETLRNLDVTVLHSLILEKILGIDKENLANQKNLKYTRDIYEAVNSVNCYANCAFFLNPTKVSQIAAVGNARQKMPQKSTYFYPKLITGLVINKMENKIKEI